MLLLKLVIVAMANAVHGTINGFVNYVQTSGPNLKGATQILAIIRTKNRAT